jgi:hypothetical protein
MRRRIPPTKQMFDIDRTNLQTFGFRDGKAVFLLPGHIRKRGGARKLPVKAGPVSSPSSAQFTGSKALSRNRGTAASQASSSVGSSYNGRPQSAGARSVGNADPQKEEDMESGDAEEADSDDEDGAEGEAGEEDEGEEEAGDEPATRGRSKTIRPDRAPPAGVVGDNTAVAGQKPRGVLSWLFGSKKDTSSTAGASQKPGPAAGKSKGLSLFGIFGGGSRQDKEAPEVDDSLEMWASAQCFYTYNVLSRQSRMQLVLRCSKLEALDGERTSYTLYNTKPKYLNTYYGLKKLLTRDCARLVVPPLSMKDLSSRPFLELQALFSSQVRICRKLDDLEHLLYHKISKYDSFLPFITTAPVFTRDLADFDKGLLNAESLILNLANENTLAQYKAARQKKSQPAAPANLQAGGADDAMAQSQFAYDSVSSAHSSTLGAGSVAHSEAPLLRQRAEEAEEVAAGKVTLSLSQSLDGANYLVGGQQQGSRDMLERYVGQDECLMVWHLPVVPSQPIQVVLVWRDHSASLHNKFSSSSPTDPADLLPGAGHKRTQKKAQGSSRAQGSPGPEAHKKGIVMEVAKSDLAASHVLQYVQVFHHGVNTCCGFL